MTEYTSTTTTSDDNVDAKTEAVDPNVAAVTDFNELYYMAHPDFFRRTELDCNLGERWQDIRTNVIPKSGMSVKKWAATYKLPCTVTFADRRAQLAREYDKFIPAHEWFEQTGKAAGWWTRKTSGCDYALEVIKLHQRALNGELPPAKPDIHKNRNSLVAERNSAMSECDRWRRNYDLVADALRRVAPDVLETVEQEIEAERLANQPDPENDVVNEADDAETDVEVIADEDEVTDPVQAESAVISAVEEIPSSDDLTGGNHVLDLLDKSEIVPVELGIPLPHKIVPAARSNSETVPPSAMRQPVPVGVGAHA